MMFERAVCDGTLYSGSRCMSLSLSLSFLNSTTTMNDGSERVKAIQLTFREVLMCIT